MGQSSTESLNGSVLFGSAGSRRDFLIAILLQMNRSTAISSQVCRNVMTSSRGSSKATPIGHHASPSDIPSLESSAKLSSYRYAFFGRLGQWSAAGMSYSIQIPCSHRLNMRLVDDSPSNRNSIRTPSRDAAELLKVSRITFRDFSG